MFDIFDQELRVCANCRMDLYAHEVPLFADPHTEGLPRVKGRLRCPQAGVKPPPRPALGRRPLALRGDADVVAVRADWHRYWSKSGTVFEYIFGDPAAE